MKPHYILVDFENVQPRNLELLAGGAYRIKVFLGANQSKVSLELARALQAFGADAEYLQIVGNGSNALDFHIAYYIGVLSTEHADAAFTIISRDTGFDPLLKHLKSRGIDARRVANITDIPHIKAIAATRNAPATPAGARPAAAGGRATSRNAPVAAKPAPAAKVVPKTPKTTPVAATAPAPAPRRASRAAPVAAAPAASPKTTEKDAAPRPRGRTASSSPLPLDDIVARLANMKAARPATMKTLRSTIGSWVKREISDEEFRAIVDHLARQGAVRVASGKLTYPT